MYRPSIKPPTTAWARHLDRIRRERDWSAVQLFEVVGDALGYSAKSRSALVPLLQDKEPTPRQAEVLRSFFGDPNPEDAVVQPAAATSGHGDLEAARLELERERLSIERERLEVARAQLGATRENTATLRAMLMQSLSPDDETRARLLPLVTQWLGTTPTPSPAPASPQPSPAP